MQTNMTEMNIRQNVALVGQDGEFYTVRVTTPDNKAAYMTPMVALALAKELTDCAMRAMKSDGYHAHAQKGA
jgi:hypothetical protein